MAKLNIKVIESKEDGTGTIILKFTNDINKKDIINSMAQMFDIEILSAEVVTGKSETTISIITGNKEKLELVRNGLIRNFRNASGIGKINEN